MSEFYFMKKLTLMLQKKLSEQIEKGFKAWQYSFVGEHKFNEPAKKYNVVVFDPDLYEMIRKEEE